MYTEIEYDQRGHVGVITLNRPEARNALTLTTYDELEDAVAHTTARCLVITGADPAFCSGDDVKQVMVGPATRGPTARDRTPRLTPAADALLHTDVPIVAAVNGAAVGWGMELALMADIRVASERARFGELFVQRGLCSDVAGLGTPRPARRPGARRRAALHRPGRRRRRGAGARARVAGRARTTSCCRPRSSWPRPIAANPPLAVQRAEARAARRARPRLARARPRG